MVKLVCKPRGRISAYSFFVRISRKEDKEKNPNQNVCFSELSKKCSAILKTMSDKTKKRFRELTEEDKKRYDKEMADYKPPKAEIRGKKRKRTKDPNAPKRALSAFILFCKEERPDVRKEMTVDVTVGVIQKELGRRWKSLTIDQKSKYESLAAEERVRYEKEVKAYRVKKADSHTNEEDSQDEKDS